MNIFKKKTVAANLEADSVVDVSDVGTYAKIEAKYFAVK
jgi:hypothetical protein